MTGRSTLRDFEPTGSHPGVSALDGWYEGIRNLPIGHFSVGDTCRSLRQGLLVDPIIQRAIELFVADPLAGEIDDGELARALKAVPLGWWRTHGREAKRVVEVTRQRLVDEGGPEALRALLGHLSLSASSEAG